MKKLRVKFEGKHDHDTFVHVAKTTGYLQPGVVYTLVEYGNDYFIRQALCVDVQTVERQNLTPAISFLDANCDLDLYQEILDSRGLAVDQLLSVATFTNVHCSREHYLLKNKRTEEPAKTIGKSIVSEKYLQSEMTLKS